jgi:hypothetical protein
MTTSTTSDPLHSTIAATSFPVLCKGCNTVHPVARFLHRVDPTCYRLRLQCWRCLEKSSKRWRAHREEIKATRAARERDYERITWVCGVSINAQYRDKHGLSKRHLSVVALLHQHSALLSEPGAPIIPPPAPAALPAQAANRMHRTFDEEVEDTIAALEKELTTSHALRSRRVSLPRSLDLPILYAPTASSVEGSA